MSIQLRPLPALFACAFAASAAAQRASPIAVDAAPIDGAQRVEVTGERQTDGSLAAPSNAGSRLTLTPLETPASVAVVPAAIVQRLGLSSVADAKTLAPGITSANSPGNGGNLLNARGFSGQNSVKQLYRGLEISNGGGVVSFPFDPWNLERIEALNGPASVLYGTGAIGGALNVVPKAPNTTRRQIDATLGAGSFNTLHQAVSATGPVNDALAYRVDISHRSSDTWIDRGQADSTAASASLRWAPSSTLRFTAALDYGKQLPSPYLGTPVYNGAPVPGTERLNYNIADNALWFEDRWLTLATAWDVADGLTLNNTVYRMNHARQYRDVTVFTYMPATSAANATVRRTSYRDIAHAPQHQEGTTTSLRHESRLAGMKLENVIGFDAFRMVYDREDNVRAGTSVVDALDPMPGQYLDAYQGQSRPEYLMNLWQVGAFAESRLVVNEQLSLLAGLRHDRYRNRRQSLLVPLPAQALTRSDLEGTGYNLGIVYQPVRDLSVYGRIASATDPVNSLASIGANQQGFQLSRGRQAEVGVKGIVPAGIEWTLAAYRLKKNDLLTPSLANPSISEQVGRQSARGIEASVSARFGPLRLDVNGTVLKAAFDEFLAQVGIGTQSLAGYVPTTVPRRSANVLLFWDIAAAWKAQVSWRYVGRRFTNNLNTAWMPAYSVIGFGGAWQPSREWRLELRVENAGDKVYGTQGSTTQWLLGSPRAAFMSALYTF